MANSKKAVSNCDRRLLAFDIRMSFYLGYPNVALMRWLHLLIALLIAYMAGGI
jgi:hypothetical protein